MANIGQGEHRVAGDSSGVRAARQGPVRAGLRRLFWIYLAGLGLYTAVMFTNGASTYIQNGILTIFWAAALFWWLMYLGDHPGSYPRSRRLYAIIPPLLVVTLLALNWTGLLLRVRFSSSQADLEALAQD